MILPFKTTNKENDSFDSKSNISDNEVNNGSKHDDVVEGAIQVESFEENWKIRNDELFISEICLPCL